jgi:hypothetical protein
MQGVVGAVGAERLRGLLSPATERGARGRRRLPLDRVVSPGWSAVARAMMLATTHPGGDP